MTCGGQSWLIQTNSRHQPNYPSHTLNSTYYALSSTDWRRLLKHMTVLVNSSSPLPLAHLALPTRSLLSHPISPRTKCRRVRRWRGLPSQTSTAATSVCMMCAPAAAIQWPRLQPCTATRSRPSSTTRPQTPWSQQTPRWLGLGGRQPVVNLMILGESVCLRGACVCEGKAPFPPLSQGPLCSLTLTQALLLNPCTSADVSLGSRAFHPHVLTGSLT